MKGLLLGIIVVSLGPLAMAGRQMASMIWRRLAGLFQAGPASPAVAAPSYAIAISFPSAEQDSVARKVVVRRALERRTRPASVRPPAVRTSWKRDAAASQVLQESGSRST
jgi:hypothetical protein